MEADDSIKGKNISTVMVNLSVTFKEKLFLKACKELHQMFINSSNYKAEQHVDAAHALKVVVCKYLLLFSQLHYCLSLLELGYNCKKSLPDVMKCEIMNMGQSIVENSQIRKILYDHNFLCTLYKSILSMSTEERDNPYALDYLLILFKIGLFSHMKVYIPGESIEVGRHRDAFLKSGGLLLIFHAISMATNKQMLAYLTGTILPEIDAKILEKQLQIINIKPNTFSSCDKLLPQIKDSTRNSTDQLQRSIVNVGKSSDSPLEIISQCLPSNTFNQDKLIPNILEQYKIKIIQQSKVQTKTTKKKISNEERKANDIDEQKNAAKQDEEKEKRLERISHELEANSKLISRVKKIRRKKKALDKLRNFSQLYPIEDLVDSSHTLDPKTMKSHRLLTTDRKKEYPAITRKLYSKYKINEYVRA